jgi:hypothetical protein
MADVLKMYGVKIQENGCCLVFKGNMKDKSVMSLKSYLKAVEWYIMIHCNSCVWCVQHQWQ